MNKKKKNVTTSFLIKQNLYNAGKRAQDVTRRYIATKYTYSKDYHNDSYVEELWEKKCEEIEYSEKRLNYFNCVQIGIEFLHVVNVSEQIKHKQTKKKRNTNWARSYVSGVDKKREIDVRTC